MKENAAQTEPAARLVAVTNAIAQGLSQNNAQLGRALQKAAARALLQSLQGVLHRQTEADRARGYFQRCFDIMGLLDRMNASDPGLLQKGMTLTDKLLQTLRQPVANTVPLSIVRGDAETVKVIPLIPLAATGFRIP